MTKTISLADDAYELMARAKQPGESFSQLTRRVFGEERRGSIRAFAGIWADRSDEWEAIKQQIYRWRDESMRPPPRLE